jgi:hypothetical protein
MISAKPPTDVGEWPSQSETNTRNIHKNTYLPCPSWLVLVVLPCVYSLRERCFMVVAVAALLLQFSVFPGTSAPAEPEPTTTTEPTTVTADTSAPKLPNLESIKFPDQPAFVDKSNSSSPLKTVAYDNGSQNSRSLSTFRVSENSSTKQSDVKYPTKYFSRCWLALSMAQSAAAGFDAYSTRYAIGHGAVEEDPVMRPFAKSPAMYAASQVGPVVLDFVTRRMQRSSNIYIRRVWWLPQIASTSLYLSSGFHNLHVGNSLSR